MTDLSVEFAVDDRGCDFTGCSACPFRIRAYPTHGCILEGGARYDSALFTLCRLVGEDPAPLLAWFAENTDAVTVDRRSFEVLDASALPQAADRIEALRDRVSGSGLVEGPYWWWVGDVEPDSVRRSAEPWLRSETREDGRPGQSLDSLRVLADQVAAFFRAAAALSRGVEVGRYRCGFVDRSASEPSGPVRA